MDMKNIVITGASRGIGRELALQFAAKGNKVWALARDSEALLSLEKEQTGIAAIVTDINEIENAVKDIKESVPSIDLLIHNAAAFINKPFKEMAYADMQGLYHTNVFAPYFLSQGLLELMDVRGQILAISSVGGIGGSLKFPGLSVYSSSKGALNIIVECLAEELKETGLTINGLALGSSATEMFKSAFPDFEAATKPGEMAQFIVNFAETAVGMVHGKVYPVSSQNP